MPIFKETNKKHKSDNLENDQKKKKKANKSLHKKHSSTYSF